jgi:hypothetical protein
LVLKVLVGDDQGALAVSERAFVVGGTQTDVERNQYGAGSLHSVVELNHCRNVREYESDPGTLSNAELTDEDRDPSLNPVEKSNVRVPAAVVGHSGANPPRPAHSSAGS